ncbi:PH domain-containing protein [Mucilaginibacter sp. SG564]|uniref:PH domain-containing protein n=1 Tax=Mucilaginibacter sp. SG564 TaxID=2587022 RepID=UPI001551D79D|nr:PH domain-containing protein [Mucilaginibacter sp. SG564]NOW95952.1 putative membrane protein YdbT with pleckstrin-like domain [Mucilaginibacter sp. SG564]
MTNQDDIILKPSVLFAFLKILPLLTLALMFLFLAWKLSPYFIVFGIAMAGFAWYRLLFIRNCEYLVGKEYIRISRGIFFKRIDQVEMYRVEDYIITQSFLLQMFRIMEITLKSTDPENPVIWLRGIPLSDLIETIRERVQKARKENRIVELN